MVLENLRWALHRGTVCQQYFTYGMDRKGIGISLDDFLPYRDHVAHQKLLLTGSADSEQAHALTQNKEQFDRVARRLNFPVPLLVATVKDGVAVKGDSELPLSRFLQQCDGKSLFCKPVTGMKGAGLFSLDVDDGALYVNGECTSLTAALHLFKGGPYLIQQRLNQHAAVRRLHPPSLNTMRLITANIAQDPEPFVATLRIGTGGATADNWKEGGVVIRLCPHSGRLSGYALPEPGRGAAVTTHPDTGLQLSGYKVPMVEEAVELACNFHANLGDVPSIAWDIAFTPDSPVVIEANVRWGSRSHVLLEPDFKKKYFDTFQPPGAHKLGCMDV